VHLMHPRTDQSQNYNIPPLVAAGYAVLGRAGRWVNHDVATEHERLLADVAAGVRLLQDRGCAQVILLGNSGGGSLAALYQWQATTAPASRLRHTVAGDEVALGAMDLPPADGIVLIGAHLGEGASLLKWIDPSVVDESDAFSVDPELDMYDPRNGFRPLPQESAFDRDFLVAYRAAQHARVSRLDAIARGHLAERGTSAAATARDERQRMAAERRAAAPHHMQIHRTMADPAFVDLSIEPDDRRKSSYNSNPRPDLQNYGNGVAQFLTPEAWLSTWSGLSTKASTVDCIRSVRQPTVIVHYAGDVITHLSEAESIYEAAAADDKTLVTVRRADHYGFAINADGSGGPRVAEGTDAVVTWMRDRFPNAQRSQPVPHLADRT
jgi:pimeloyl-ACP methyl ester carboxylesterase